VALGGLEGRRRRGSSRPLDKCHPLLGGEIKVGSQQLRQLLRRTDATRLDFSDGLPGTANLLTERILGQAERPAARL
jgi:hypothetical protein